MRRERAHIGGARVGRPGGVLLLGATAGVVIASAVLAVMVRGPDASPNRRLAEAVGAHRVTRARLTGGFAYVPCETITPNDSLVAGLLCDRTNPARWREADALANVGNEMHRSVAPSARDANQRHAVGSWHVVWGNPDAAIEEYRAAAELDSKNARLQSDLSAALLARAERAQDPRSIVDAYEAADSALSLDSVQLEARFNRAVALEWLHLATEADSAWSAYLDLDSRSQWADEARERRQRLRKPTPDWNAARKTLRDAVETGRDSVIRELTRTYSAGVRDEARRAFTAWATAQDAAAIRRDSLLTNALRLSRAVADVTGDSLWADAVGAVVASTAAKRDAETVAVAKGLVAYERGDAFYTRSSTDSAEHWFRQSNSLLRHAGSPAHYWAAFGLALVAYSRQSSTSYADALVLLESIRATAPKKYRVVRGLAARTEGLIHGIGANFGAAIAAYTAATEEGRGTGDAGLEVRPHANLAVNFANLGDERAAWAHIYQALRSVPPSSDLSTDAQRVFMRSADLSAGRSPKLALLFLNRTIALAGRPNATAADSGVMLAALRRKAELLGRQRRTAAALESVRKGRSYLANIADDSTRAVSGADMDLVEAQAWLAERPDSSVRVLQRVVTRFHSTQYFRQIARAELLLASAYTATGEMDHAQVAFEAALTEVERQRSAIVGSEERRRFLDQARPVFDTLVSFHADRGNALKALEFVEQTRGRVLLDQVRSDASVSVETPEQTIAAVRRDLTPGTAIVSYAVLKSEVVAWVIRADTVSMHRTPTSSAFAAAGSRFSSAIASRMSGATTSAIASQLYQILVAPIAAEIKDARRLVIIPDKALHVVPFAALLDSAASQFLIEKFEINVVPSLQLYRQSEARYAELRQTPPRQVLAVGNPSFDERVFSLPRLTGAEQEARHVASSYPRAEVLIGAQATKAAFVSGATEADVVHFAGHGVVRSDAPLLSYLLLASAEGDNSSGTLTAQELFAKRLPKTRLAILSGCETASGPLSVTEGASSLARAFFAAGVPAVIASLWAVDDEATANFFRDFHRGLAQGEDPNAALRRVQLQWLKNDKDRWSNASTWAAFTLFGATTRSPDGKS